MLSSMGAAEKLDIAAHIAAFSRLIDPAVERVVAVLSHGRGITSDILQTDVTPYAAEVFHLTTDPGDRERLMRAMEIFSELLAFARSPSIRERMRELHPREAAEVERSTDTFSAFLPGMLVALRARHAELLAEARRLAAEQGIADEDEDKDVPDRLVPEEDAKRWLNGQDVPGLPLQ